ncbi:lethal (2) SH0834 isoform X2 [Haematobia irritans]|uniref:lethal (2) SH0834 isoform X2 n=1 Tax=Haematobia irritans TaxID=7368 RepID=UPI003F4FCD0B
MQTMDNADETSNATLENSDQIEKDKINQRREARRRKILDNAKNRLEKLNGRTISNDEMMRNDGVPRNKARINNDHFNGLNIKSTENTEFSDPEVEPDLIPQSMRPFLRDSFQFPDGNFANTTLQQDSMPANNFPDIFDMFQTPEVKERHVLFKARLHLVVSALISCVLTIFWKQNENKNPYIPF